MDALVQDGVFGPKTRARLCYLVSYTGTTSGSSISAMGRGFLKKWQEYLNYQIWDDWTDVRYGPNPNQVQTLENYCKPLTVDGLYGSKSAAATGGWVLKVRPWEYESQGGALPLNAITASASNTYWIQQRLNQIFGFPYYY